VAPLLEKVRDTIVKHGLLIPHSRVVVGFSGGVDSVCLLHLLKNLPDYDLKLWALYINHVLRPVENQREIELLQQVGREWGVQTHQIKIDIPGKLARKPQSLQLLARVERYRAFEAFSREIGATRIALAHHQDDQAETIFYRIIRGTGLDGLAGMSVIRDNLYIRPLLAVTRKEILQYAQRHQLTWVEDSSNQKVIYTRNRIRHQLIPEIEAGYNPRFKDGLLRLAGLAREQHEYMASNLERLSRELICTTLDRVGLRLTPFLEQHPFIQYCLLKTVLAQIQPHYQIESRLLQKLRAKLNRERGDFKRMQLTKGIMVAVTGGLVTFESPHPANFPAKQSFAVTVPGVTALVDCQMQLTVSPVETPPQWCQLGNMEIYLDAAQVALPLRVRFRRTGDAFEPLGISGTQKLHDFFIDHKIPRGRRDAIPLLVDAYDRIIWVIGYRVSDVCKVTAATTEIWRINAVETGDNLG
jgi:tRNA(Ile)-lysidine synthase